MKKTIDLFIEMKKTIDLFFDEAPYWQVFLVLSILLSLFIFSFISIFSFIEIKNSLSIMIKLTIGLSSLFGFMGTLLTHISRKSTIFWEESKNLSCKIHIAETKKELEKLHDHDLNELKKLSFGNAHYEEVRRLLTIMMVKHKYLK
jgi:hypothetical protein